MKKVVLVIAILMGLPLISGGQAANGFRFLASTTNTTYVDQSCPNGMTCLYHITAVNSVQESPASNIVSVTVPARGAHLVELHWQPPAKFPNVQIYNIYASYHAQQDPGFGLSGKAL